MSRRCYVNGAAYRSYGKSADVAEEPEWRAEKVLARQRLERMPERFKRNRLHEMANANRPRGKKNALQEDQR